MNALRILHLTDRVTGRGGAHRHLLGVLERLTAAGHELRLVAGARDDETTPTCDVAIVPGLEARDDRPVPGLEPVLAAFSPDVVHVHTVVNPWVLAWAAQRGAVMTVQDHRYFCPGKGKWTTAGDVCRDRLGPRTCAACFDDDAYFQGVLGLTEARLGAVRRMRRLIVLSDYMRRELVEAGVDSDRVAVVPPFVHGLPADAQPDGASCVLFVGRLAIAKGVRDAVAAWRVADVGLPLVFAGTGPLREELEAGGFEVLGWLPPDRLARTYRRARALLLPSRWQEPFGLAGLEALHMGVPVAAWDSGGVREWHGAESLAPWGDVPALAAALCARIGTRAVPPPGFDPKALTDRLMAEYRAVGTLR